jgi:GTPase SAR1 family protein
MLMFDICNEESFTALDNWIEVVRELADEAKLMIVGTKADLVEERVVSRERAEKYAQNLNIPYCETSSKGHVNVMEAFMTIVSKLVDSHTEYMLKNSVCMSPMSMGAVSVSSSSNHTQLAGCCKLG